MIAANVAESFRKPDDTRPLSFEIEMLASAAFAPAGMAPALLPAALLSPAASELWQLLLERRVGLVLYRRRRGGDPGLCHLAAQRRGLSEDQRRRRNAHPHARPRLVATRPWSTPEGYVTMGA